MSRRAALVHRVRVEMGPDLGDLCQRQHYGKLHEAVGAQIVKSAEPAAVGLRLRQMRLPVAPVADDGVGKPAPGIDRQGLANRRQGAGRELVFVHGRKV